jgi:hypothetical protein
MSPRQEGEPDDGQARYGDASEGHERNDRQESREREDDCHFATNSARLRTRHSQFILRYGADHGTPNAPKNVQ